MTLRLDVEKVRDFEELDKNVNSAFAYHSMFIGMNEITVNNWEEWYARISLVESVSSPMLIDRPITPGDVLRRVGLRTNVSLMTMAQFRRNVYGLGIDRAQREIKKYIEDESEKLVV